MPVYFLNIVEKYWLLEKSRSRASSVMDQSGLESICFAFSTRLHLDEHSGGNGRGDQGAVDKGYRQSGNADSSRGAAHHR